VRSCPECIEADFRSHGFYWYRLRHQVPGADWCWKHSTQLSEVGARIQIVRGLPANLRQLQRGPDPKPKRIPPFVRRYLRVLEWLQSRACSWKWDSLKNLLASRLPGYESRLRPDWTEAVETALVDAPAGWVTKHFIKPWSSSQTGRAVGYAFGSVAVAVVAAFQARSDDDLEELLLEATAERFAPVPFALLLKRASEPPTEAHPSV
jgi:hypothetical protein